MTKTTPARNKLQTPRVEQRLQCFYDDAAAVEAVCQQFLAAGVEASALPTQTDRRAFALLGEERPGEDLARRLEMVMPALVNRGVVGSGRQPAAVARFLLSVTHLMDGLRSPVEIIDARLQNPGRGPGPVIVCPTRATGTWGQTLQVPLQVSANAEYLLVRPDLIFGAGEVVERLEPGRDSHFWFEIPCDHGEVLIAAISGEGVSRHVVYVEIS